MGEKGKRGSSDKAALCLGWANDCFEKRAFNGPYFLRSTKGGLWKAVSVREERGSGQVIATSRGRLALVLRPPLSA